MYSKFLKIFFLIGVFLSHIGSGFFAEELTIAFVYDGHNLENYPYFKKIREEIDQLLRDEFTLHFEEYEGDWTTSGISKAYNNAIANEKVDAVVTLGIIAAQEALLASDRSKPVLVPFVFGQEMQHFLGLDVEVPKNYFPLLGEKSFKSELETLHKTRPFKTLAVIGDASIIGENQSVVKELFAQTMRQAGIDSRFIPVAQDINPVIKSLQNNPVDAVFIYPTWRIQPEDFRRMVLAIADMGIPTFSFLGEQEVEMGVLLTTTPASHLRRASRRIALNLQELFSKSLDGSVELRYPEDWDLIINAEVAQKLNLDLPWDLVGMARFVGEKREVNGKVLGLTEAVAIALESNLEVEEEAFRVRREFQELCGTRSLLMPHIFGKARTIAIDADRARLAQGLFSQVQTTAALAISHSIYDDALWTEYRAKKCGIWAQIYTKESIELSVVQQAALAYVDVQRRSSAVQTAYDNLQRTKANLQRAKERVKAGEAGPAEIYRWESHFASSQSSLFVEQGSLDNTHIFLKRILNLPFDQEIALKPPTHQPSTLFLDIPDIDSYFESRQKFHTLREFFFSLSLENSPEIKALDMQIEAQRELYQGAARASYTPKVGMYGEIGRVFRGGAGTRNYFGQHADDVDMILGVEASIPLYTAGGIRSEKNRTCMELQRLFVERENVKRLIQEHIYANVENIRTKTHNIYLAKKAADLAQKNLDIITDSYSNGLISIIDLIDAQNASFVANLDSLNAVYDLLSEYIMLQRVCGIYFFTLDQQEKGEYQQRLIQFATRSGERNG